MLCVLRPNTDTLCAVLFIQLADPSRPSRTRALTEVWCGRPYESVCQCGAVEGLDCSLVQKALDPGPVYTAAYSFQVHLSGRGFPVDI